MWQTFSSRYLSKFQRTVVISVWKSSSRNWKKTGTEPDWTAKNRTVGCSSSFSEIKNRLKLLATEPVWTGCNQFSVHLNNAHIFEEKRARIACSMAKMICYTKIQLCAISRTCVFWHLEVLYYHKKIIDSNYTLYMYNIVYNWFYLIYTRKILVPISFNWLQFKPVQTDLDRSFAIFCGFDPVFFCISALGNRLQLRFVQK